MGSGSGNLAGYPFAKFPGAYDMKDPGKLPANNATKISGLVLNDER
jgi:hypothetical protein